MSLETEYRAAKESAGLIDLSTRGKIEVTGQDRVSFLHNILTQDIKNIRPGECAPAALLSAPAKVLALMNVWKFEDKILLDTEPGLEEKLIGLLDKFLITEDIQLRNVTKEYSLFSIYEKQGTGRRYCLSPALETETTRRSLITAGAVPIGQEVAEILRIEAGILRYGVDVTEEVSLPETGLDDIYASETKGCYPGQEVVARTRTYKGLQRKMTGLVISRAGVAWPRDLKTEISPGCARRNDLPKIYSGEKEIGWMTSACVSPALGGIALGYVLKGFFEKAVEVEIKTTAGVITAKTAELPFK